MSRILLLILFMIWMAGPPVPQPAGESWPNLVLFFSFYAMLVLLLGLWSRALARRVAMDNFHRSLRRFNQVMFAARIMVPVWFTIGVWGLGWGGLIGLMGTGLYKSVVGMLLGTLPAFATWMGLWWSQYPAERALREQNLLVDLENGSPLYGPPPFRSYFLANFRLQVLFTLLPVALIVLVHDALLWSYLAARHLPFSSEVPQAVDLVTLLLSSGSVFLFAPALLTRVLKTEPMTDSTLRRRLDELCRRAGVKYRQILVWNTNNHVGNAAVMGVIPRLRYVLLSDVLLERMNNEEIEAVFAHELGHVVHRHMSWYAIFFVVLLLSVFGLALILKPYVDGLAYGTGLGMAAVMAAFFFLFGALSRRCERQADVFAARMMEMLKAEEPIASENLNAARQVATIGAGRLIPEKEARAAHVGRYGAGLFASALRRVAMINNIPITPKSRSRPGVWNRLTHAADALLDIANNWLHGSISSRMQYLQDLSTDPRLTNHFDRTMFWLYCGILFALFMSVLVLSVAPGTMM